MDTTYIYFIQEESKKNDGAIKIGCSQDVRARNNGLQTGNSQILKVISTIEGTQKEEKRIHELFATHRIRSNSEWFNPHPEIVSFAEAFNDKKLNGALIADSGSFTRPKQLSIRDMSISVDSDEEIGKVYKTKDYDKFIIDPQQNRPINRAYVKQLAGSIQSKNLLHLVPIAIDAYFRIIDGQHRKEAAKILQVPLYYIINDKPIPKSDVIRLNTTRREWKFDDYLQAHLEQGIIDYFFLSEYKKAFPKLTNSNILLILSGRKDYAQIHNVFKEGNFIFDHTRRDHFYNVGQILTDFRSTLNQLDHPEKASVTHKYFVSAIVELEPNPDFDYRKCLKTIRRSPGKYYYLNSTLKDYIFMLEKGVNYRVAAKNQVILR